MSDNTFTPFEYITLKVLNNIHNVFGIPRENTLAGDTNK